MRNLKNLIIIVSCMLCLAMCVVSLVIIQPNRNFRRNRDNMIVEVSDKNNIGRDKIHFLNTGSSDAILIESDGHFALIDAGEDSDNPRGFEELELEGFEEKVLVYLKDNASDKNGIVHLDFVLGTHSHSDHIGGFDTIISDDAVKIDCAYLKQYDSSKIRQMEIDRWDNQEVYDQMVNALNEKNIPIISQPDSKPFNLGNFTITLFNTIDPENDTKVGENDQSLGVLVEKNGTKIFIAGDIDNYTGDEDRIAQELGKINLLKVGHHSYSGSTTKNWLKTLMPETCVVTNKYENLDMRTIRRITRVTNATILVTGKENGIIADIGDNGEITYYNQIH